MVIRQVPKNETLEERRARVLRVATFHEEEFRLDFTRINSDSIDPLKVKANTPA